MLGAVIRNGSATLVADLPRGTTDLMTKLLSIGVSQTSDNIRISDEDEDAAHFWWDLPDLNQGCTGLQPVALPTELRSRITLQEECNSRSKFRSSEIVFHFSCNADVSMLEWT